MRKALIVGIDHYEHMTLLSGCANDARAVKDVLARNADGTTNFVTPRLVIGTDASDVVTKRDLKDAVRDLFRGNSDIALLYFAGHGHIEDTGGYLCTGDSLDGDDGLSFSDLMTLANASKAKNKVIILDSCYSGAAATQAGSATVAEVQEGMTILTASTAEQYAMEVPGGGAGVFTSLLVDALRGAAANLIGDVTPGSVYAHIDQSLGTWAQRPVFKTNVKQFVSLRKATAPIPLADLQALATHFPTADYQFALDPAYEPERSLEQLNDPSIPPPDTSKTEVFAVLQRYVKVNLVQPVGAPHMWHAATQSKGCELTILGKHYRKLVADELI
ncbi:Caspase domain-containing protein [Burkholderia sp. D7]|nr:Caspase domain-containing protein [Burkholderia sp. D7]